MLVFTSCMMYMLLADLEKSEQPLATITHIPSGTNFLFLYSPVVNSNNTLCLVFHRWQHQR